MATHDYNIANADGATVRADINSVLEAVATNNSSSTAPSVTFPYMRWHDTANSQLKERNGANTAWIVVADIVAGELVPHAGGAQVPQISGGADANFTAMPQVGGDPVVESGSNTDGEWTRWADGTQLCRKSDSTVLGEGSLTGGVYVSGGIEIFLAQAFIGQPHGTVGAGSGSAASGFWMTFAGSIDSSSGFARAYRNESFTTGDNGTFQVMAIGRWK